MLYVNPQAQPGFRAFDLAPGATGRETEALKQFEQLFLFQMLQEMRKTVPNYGVLESGSQKEYFEEMMDDFLAGEMADSGQFGVAKQMAQQLHARERTAETKPGGTTDPRSPQSPGIPLRESHTGIALPRETPNGIALERGEAGIPLKRNAFGIPLNRAHERYLLNQATVDEGS